MELRWMNEHDVDAVVAASALFDEPATREWATRFLADPNHYVCIAYEENEPAGFVSGVEMTHPDKGTEMFLYELGVAERARGRGVGRALVGALADLARKRGCYGMWTATETDNVAARR